MLLGGTRPPNARELGERDPIVVECFPYRREVAVTQVMGEKNSTKTFQFDKVFDGNARQEDIYLEVVVPIVEEVLTGYNCTIFAYAPLPTPESKHRACAGWPS